MAKRLIDGNSFVIEELLDRDKTEYLDTFVDGVRATMKAIRTAPTVPTAEVEPVRHGHWIFKRQYHGADECNCSNCGQLMTTVHGVRMPYCPQCGFIMDGGNDNEM